MAAGTEKAKIANTRRYVYTAIARMLPTEGRDYSVSIASNPEGAPSVRIRGLTQIGKVFAQYCADNIQQTITIIQEEESGKTRK